MIKVLQNIDINSKYTQAVFLYPSREKAIFNFDLLKSYLKIFGMENNLNLDVLKAG